MLVASLLQAAAAAEPPAASPSAVPPAAGESVQSAPSDATLLGDLGGLRPWLHDYGATFTLEETSEILGNVTGGTRRAAIYEGLTDASLQFDLRPHYHWRGVFFVHALQIHGRGLTGTDLGNIDTVSNIEATATTRLRELWYEQHIGDWLRIRIGQQSVDTEFIVSSSERVLVNGTFGWPALPGSDLPSSGPAYPLATPAVRVRVDANEALTFFAGAFNGDPAGPGSGDPQRRDPSGTGFRTSDGVFAIAEVRYNPGASDANGTYKFGAWYNSQPFADLRRDFSGLSLADPASSGRALTHRGDYSVYGVIDQPLWPAGEGGGPVAFVRVMGAPSDRNLVDFYVDGGLAYQGPFGRPKDTAAIAFGYTRIGRAARKLDADMRRFTGQAYPIRSAEILIEMTYQAQLLPWLQLQPDLQYVIDPGGGIPDPARPGRRIGDALILGLRTNISF